MPFEGPVSVNPGIRSWVYYYLTATNISPGLRNKKLLFITRFFGGSEKLLPIFFIYDRLEYHHPSQDKTLNCCNEFFPMKLKDQMSQIHCPQLRLATCFFLFCFISPSPSFTHKLHQYRFSSHIMSYSDRPGPSTFRTFLTFSKNTSR